jgi:hypothetical protein
MRVLGVHVCHFIVSSARNVLAEGRYKMLYIESECACGNTRGRYTSPVR